MRKLKQHLETALTTEPKGLQQAVRAVSFDRQTIARLMIGGIIWYTIQAELDRRGLSEADVRLLNRLTPVDWARYIHESLQGMS